MDEGLRKFASLVGKTKPEEGPKKRRQRRPLALVEKPTTAHGMTPHEAAHFLKREVGISRKEAERFPMSVTDLAAMAQRFKKLSEDTVSGNIATVPVPLGSVIVPVGDLKDRKKRKKKSVYARLSDPDEPSEIQPGGIVLRRAFTKG